MATPPEQPLWRVVVDANLFFTPPVRDLFFYGSARADPVLAVLWSDAILAEVARNWARVTGTVRAEARWRHFEARFRAVFARGRIAETVPLPAASRVAWEDRHVVGTALAGRADGIVTFNRRDFPAAELAAYGLRVWSPDALGVRLLARFPAGVVATLREQGAALHPECSLTEVIVAISPHCPRFAAAASALVARSV